MMGLGSRMGAMHLASERGCSDEDDEDDSCDEDTREAFECGSEYAVTHTCMRCGGAIVPTDMSFYADGGSSQMNTAATYEHKQAMDRIRNERQYSKERKMKEYAAKKEVLQKRVDKSKYGYEDWQNGVKGAKAPGGVKSKPAPKATVKDAAKAKLLSGLSSMGLGGRNNRN
jgi:hypothetical protein